jgi:predicted ATPase with chaperone activity
MQPSQEDLACVFQDLLVSEELQHQIGQAVHSGKGFFLYGAPGNGKTSVAERVARAFGQDVWIPRTIGIGGEIVRLYDPCNHEELSTGTDGYPNVPFDRRWVRIRRPTVIAGGELTMDRLEITVNKATGVNEAPLQLKSNCGVLVIDDFGRQRMAVAELLNRWIVPLDRRYDFLNLPSGKTVQVPFDQLLVFSTNLEPRDLVDEAFLRRISYKIEVPDPTLNDFRMLLARYAKRIGITYEESAIEHLIREHYETANRPVRACHARDLLDHVSSYCGYRRLPLEMSCQAFDAAVKNYFGLMG